MVIFVGHDHVIIWIASYRRRPVKLTLATTMASELKDVVTFTVENLLN